MGAQASALPRRVHSSEGNMGKVMVTPAVARNLRREVRLLSMLIRLESVESARRYRAQKPFFPFVEGRCGNGRIFL